MSLSGKYIFCFKSGIKKNHYNRNNVLGENQERIGEIPMMFWPNKYEIIVDLLLSFKPEGENFYHTDMLKFFSSSTIVNYFKVYS